MNSSRPGTSPHVEVQLPNFSMDLEDMDFLEMTSSQETTLLVDIHNVMNSENLCPNVQPQVVSAPPVPQQMSDRPMQNVINRENQCPILQPQILSAPPVPQQMRVFQTQSVQQQISARCSGISPIYYFPHSEVHIYHH